ncbi:MAG: hypothetical protein JWQ90_4374 [Hydrocarboniphaga sp.]|uniref:hypothetical protein n=1 Tax=Hydrocarboniphaga sp. TaxID=2033016 RepID=UPI00261C3D51|nr:hypothetical protein [Hydrocarboniphaga sp.]MDB5971924.1 hypothetical protein [Hydrocarboniphaga sp.]
MFDSSTFTIIHTVLSVVALLLGLVSIGGLLSGKSLSAIDLPYLATSVATSVTGFGFPFLKFLPSHGVGILSLIALTIAVYARTVGKLEGGWRWKYAVSTTVSVYFLVFVGVAQSFTKVELLHAAAPTLAEGPFVATQAGVLLLFVLLGVGAVRMAPRGLGLARTA